MHPIAIINQSQAFYYKALYSAVAESEEFQVNYITLDKHWAGFQGHSFPRELVIPENCDVHELRCKKLPIVQFFKPVAMFKLLSKMKPALIIMHEFTPFNWGGWLYAKLNRVPLIVSTELGLSNRKKFSFQTRALRRLLRNVDGVIAHSPAAMKTDLKIKDGAEPSRAYHALDTRKILPRSTDDIQKAIKLVFLGSIIPRKGIDLLFEALSAASDANIIYHLDLIGGGDIKWAQACAEKAKIEAHITFHGKLTGDDIDGILRRNEVFVLPSRFDTYGAVTHEAASRGLALLISKNAGSTVMIDEGVNGYVFDPEDKAAFCKLLKNFQDFNRKKLLMEESYKSARLYSAHESAGSILRAISLLMKS